MLVRRPPIPKLNPHGPVPNMPNYHQAPLSGGELTIAIVPVSAAATATGQPSSSQQQRNPPSQQQPSSQSDNKAATSRTPIDRIKAQMQERLKLRAGGRPSDEVEQHRFEVTWKPVPGAVGVMLAPVELDTSGLEVVRRITPIRSFTQISIGPGLSGFRGTFEEGHEKTCRCHYGQTFGECTNLKHDANVSSFRRYSLR